VIGFLDALARPVLFRLDPEDAHKWAIRAFKALQTLPRLPAPPDDPRLAVFAFGLDFPNPIGLAAGFDKNGEVIDAILRLGFGFTEVGTITPLAQGGQSRPRLFRLTRDEAVINRLGFPSQGHAAVHARLALRAQKPGIVGINLGANKVSSDRAADYARGIEIFADVADYFAINVSSPNTPGLRDLQRADALDDFLARVLAARDIATERVGRKPVLLKIAPDLTLAELDEIIYRARARKIDGLIVSNTTVSRPTTLRDPSATNPAASPASRCLRFRHKCSPPSVSVDRRWRRRPRGNRRRQDRGRRKSRPALHILCVRRACACGRNQARPRPSPRAKLLSPTR
jgi:dihydroorotate dehydrogenase